MSNPTEVTIPDIGDIQSVDVIEVLVAPGDSVQRETPLVTLESDKATMEVPSSVAGVVKELKVKVGDSLSEGKVVALIEVAEGEAAKPAAAAPAPTVSAAAVPPAPPLSAGAASPTVLSTATLMATGAAARALTRTRTRHGGRSTSALPL